MRNLRIPAGLPKCASTLIQATMLSNLECLRRSGVSAYYPQNMENLPFYYGTRDILNGRAAAHNEKIWPPVIYGENCIAYSFEDAVLIPNNIFKKSDLMFGTRGAIEYILDLASKNQLSVEFHIVLRPERDWLTSYYVQTVQKGRSWSFREFYNASNVSSVNWKSLVEIFNEAGASLKLHDFGAIRGGQERFLRNFFSSFLSHDVANEMRYDSKVFNESISDSGLRIMRHANTVLEADKDKATMRRILQENFSSRTHGKAQVSWEEIPSGGEEVKNTDFSSYM